MTTQNLVAIVAGGSGLTGSYLLKELLANPDFQKIKILSRRPLNLEHPRFEVILVEDMTQLNPSDPRLKADLFFCCLGTTIKKAGSQQKFREVDYVAIKRFGEAAKQQEARGFILISAMGASVDSRLFYNRIKGETEKAILGLQIPRTVIFRPSLLIGDRHESRFFEHLALQLVRKVSPLLSPPIQKQIGTKVDLLARRMVEESRSLRAEAKIIPAQEI